MFVCASVKGFGYIHPRGEQLLKLISFHIHNIWISNEFNDFNRMVSFNALQINYFTLPYLHNNHMLYRYLNHLT